METKLVYKNDFEKNAYSLVELSSPELVAAFETGKSLVIKGLADDEAVLCTDDKTYIVRQVNTSNSIILVSENKLEEQHVVHDDLSNTIELLPCLARLGRLDDLLMPTAYSGPENESAIKHPLYTLDELLSVVQASRQETMRGLEERGAFEHDGHLRVFEKDYLFRLFDSLMTNMTIQGLDVMRMSMEEAKTCLFEEMIKQDDTVILPDHILEAAIRTMINKTEGEFIQFDQAKVCRFLGEWMLTNPRNKKWRLEEFLDFWSSMGHAIFKPKLEFLDGLYVSHETETMDTVEKYISYFPVHELSTDPPRRFAALFSEKPLWTLEQIQPFLMDLAPQKKDREVLLLKYARMHKNNGFVLYGSRIK